MKKLRVLLADDHKMVREGLRLLIDSQRDMRVVGEAANGQEALLLVHSLKPEVVVMDLSMPELNGLQATERLRAELPATKVIALTVHEDPTYLIQLCQAGAMGYVLKRSAGNDLIRAIRAVAGGAVCFDAAVANRALRGQVGVRRTKGSGAKADLSDREKEVLKMLAWGHSNKEIAGDLSISVKTVETYRVRMGEKLGLRSRTQMVQYALRQGWLAESQPSTRATGLLSG